ncbi:pyridoxal phosphate-dependent aminotransferase [Sphingobacterium sp. DR205]|uniref:pyridoxal phosphate-dependent aminotransferase n=1 Tax=Sphingobacterium sp. DR205 TaxID=2713573 RepID=UPI0013E4DAC9|nr:pyridoxal phosphate-dependent aminotransferase [Sphingobacterium sp. DR205]QIH33414.1 pyridoxal phosphate-dependent aminotransferase [Sphingobacterium sp. DR205]
MSSLNRMYEMFALHSNSAREVNEPSIALSAGVNWMDSNKFIINLLKEELDSGLTHKSYGRSSGFKFITDIISHLESDICGKAFKPSVIMTNGTANASFLICSFLKKNNRFKRGDNSLMINHGFPFYSGLSESFGLKYSECLLPKASLIKNQRYLTPISQVVDKIREIKPRLIYLILPNNPFGEQYSKEDLSTLQECVLKEDSFLIVDRVCMMPWDDFSKNSNVFFSGIERGNVFVVDSFSKAESVSGLRVGFLLTNKINEEGFTDLIRIKYLNPRSFGTITLAISRVLSYLNYSIEDTEGAKYTRMKNLVNKIVEIDYPILNKQALVPLFEHENIKLYLEETEKRKQTVMSNYDYLLNKFKKESLIPISLEAGLSSAVILDQMKADSELNDVNKLASQFNVGVLSESCFRSTPNNDENYFIRIGLSIPTQMFTKGIDILYRFYKNK